MLPELPTHLLVSFGVAIGCEMKPGILVQEGSALEATEVHIGLSILFGQRDLLQQRLRVAGRRS